MAATDGIPVITPDEDEDVVITKETYKGKEVVIVDKPESQIKVSETPYVREGHFPFMSLPAELRLYINSFLIPCNMVIMHKRFEYRNDWSRTTESDWLIWCTPKHDDKALPPAFPSKPSRRRGKCTLGNAQTQLFRINKSISDDALGVLYGSNTYKFTVNGKSHHPDPMVSMQMFGPFGDSNYKTRRSCLRDMRSIHIEVLLDACDHWAVKRQRARLEVFVEALKRFSDDAENKSLLEKLRIDLVMPKQDEDSYAPDTEEFIFGLESLAALRGIKDVEVSGVPEWYARCLQLCIQGKGGNVKEVEWNDVEVTRTRKTRLPGEREEYQVWVAQMKWWQPLLDWKEFAERNGIEVPKDIGKYWEVIE